METKEMLPAVEETITSLEQLVDSFTEAELNQVPFAGSWTAGQVVRHIVISIGGFLEMVNGPVKETTRDPYQQVEKLKELFLNFTIKMKAPGFTEPAERKYNKAELLDPLASIKKDFERAINDLDLTQTCTLFELPEIGYLTRAEAVAFVVYHTLRHIHQLKNIREALLHTN